VLNFSVAELLKS